MRTESTDAFTAPILTRVSTTSDELFESAACEVTTDWPARLGRLVKHVADRWGLTERQRHVLDLVARGKTNKQVAATLGISERTVEIHIHSITIRAGLQGRNELLAALLRDALENRFGDRLTSR